jgi:aspartyl-tRNA(Asn)/glutamyl-tRNA(Gln) amidotransferase subunit A
LEKNQTSSRALTEATLERIFEAGGEGKLVFTRVYAEEARQASSTADQMRVSGSSASSIVGLPISIKELFDVTGEVTLAGSTALRGHEPAKRDAEVVGRLRRAGAVIVGRTNMSEFAFTGVGINPHYGTPANPYDRPRRRIPGGSSSGAPVSVADGMSLAAIGTDTGGSIRIPAALCGLTGFKPTQRRVPREGVFPLSPTLDSVGVIANTVSCCAEVDAVLAGEKWNENKIDLKSKTFALPANYFLDDLDNEVAGAFERAVSKLSAAGAKVLEIRLPEAEQIGEINARGGISAPEAYAYHRQLKTDFTDYDPLVRERILRGKDISAAEYLEMLHKRDALIRSFNRSAPGWDVLLCPTVPIIAPEIASLEEDPELYRRTNRLLLRNPSIVNFLDGCALTIPCHDPGDAPVGLMLIGRTLADHMLLNVGIAVEQVVTASNR